MILFTFSFVIDFIIKVELEEDVCVPVLDVILSSISISVLFSKEIFSKVDELKKYRLDVPQVTQLAYELKKEGVDMPDGILTIEELADTICNNMKG